MSSRTLILYLLLLVPVLLAWWVQSRVRRVFQQEDQFENAGMSMGWKPLENFSTRPVFTTCSCG